MLLLFAEDTFQEDLLLTKLKTSVIATVVALCIASIYLFSNHNIVNNKQDVDVNFVVLTKHNLVHKTINTQTFLNEIKILNKYFIDEDGKKIFDFKFKSAYKYAQIKDSNCSFLKYGDIKKYNTKEVSELYWRCEDDRVRDPQAINFYIVDSYSKDNGYDSGTSHGKNARNHPFILMDWERLNHKGQSPEEHEMGHAFGLGHVCDKDATTHSDTNIMASTGNCEGSGGLRNIGFNEHQVRIINKHYIKIKQIFDKN